MSDELTVTCPRCGHGIREEEATACPECGWSMEAAEVGVPVILNQKGVMLRDLVIFQVKLFLDGVKDLVLMPVALGAFLLDILPRSSARTGQNFYAVMRAGERFDLWLNLYDATKRVDAGRDGLFGESLAGANNLIGQVEQAVRQTVELGKEKVEAMQQKRQSGDDDESGEA